MSLQVLAANAVSEDSFEEGNSLHSEFKELNRFSKYDNPLEGEFPSAPAVLENLIKHLSFQNGLRPTDTCLHGEVVYGPENTSEILQRIPREYLSDYVNLKDENEETALFQAARAGQADAIRTILAYIPKEERAETIHQKERWGATALTVAADFGNLEVVQELLRTNDVSVEDCGRAVVNAACHGHLEIVQELLRSGNISKKDCGKALKKVAFRGQLNVVQELLGSGYISTEAR